MITLRQNITPFGKVFLFIFEAPTLYTTRNRGLVDDN